MITYLTVKQMHRVTKEKSIMYDGQCECTKTDGCTILKYTEKAQSATVCVCLYHEEMTIERHGEVLTQLNFHQGKKTVGKVLSEFGTIELEILTHKYIRKENVIALEYDVMSAGEVSDGYRIIWMLKEGQI